MNIYIKYIVSTLGGMLIVGGIVYAATLPVFQGGTGNSNTKFPNNSIITANFDGSQLIGTSSQLTVGSLLSTTSATSIFRGSLALTSLSQGLTYVGTNGLINTVATTSVTCSGSTTCTTFTAIGPSPITISSSGSGSGTVSAGLAGQLGYYNTSGTTIQGTSTNPLYVTSLFATSTTATSTFLGAVGIGTTYPKQVNTNSWLTLASPGATDGVASTTDNTTLSTAIWEAYAPGSRVFIGAHGASQVTTQYGLAVGGWGELGAIDSSFGTSNGLLIGTRTTNTPIVFGTNSVERMRILGSGFVGIGTSTPTYLLNPSSATAPQLALSAGAGVPQWTLRNAGGDLFFSTTTVAGNATTSTAALTIKGNGAPALAVSSSTPWGTLSINPLSGDFANQFVIGSTSKTNLVLNNAGFFGLGTTSPGSILSVQGVANFTTATSTFYPGTGGISLTGGCFAIGTTCIGGSGGGSGTVTNVATGYGAHGGPITTTGTITTNNYASYVVSTSSSTGDFTDVQSALNALPAAGGKVHVTCGTFTLPTASVGIKIKTANTILEGSGNCTQFNFDRANTPKGLAFDNSDLENVQIRGFYLHQTNGTRTGSIGIDASNTPLFIIEQIKIDGTATSTQQKCTKDLCFYDRISDMDLRDNNVGLEIGGNPVNDNIYSNIRVAPTSGNGGFCYFINSSSANGAQALQIDSPNCEPTGAATGLTGIYADNAVDITITNPYVEGLARAWNLTANSQRITFYGGEFISNTTYINNGSNNQWLGVDKESQAYNLIMASSTIADVSGNDASVPSLSFIGNTNFAKVAPVIKIDLANGSDSSNAVAVTNPGTGSGLWSNSTGTGNAASTTGKVFMNKLTAASGTPGSLCYVTTTNQVTQNNALTCTVSSRMQKNDEGYLQGDYLDTLMMLRPTQFAYKDQPNRSRWGFYAEDVASVDTRLGDGYDTNGNPQSLDQNAILAVTVKAVQELAVLKGAVTKRSVEENWQWIVIGLLLIGFVSQQIQIKKLRAK